MERSRSATDANGRHDATQLPHLIDQLMALEQLANLAFRRLTGTRAITDATTSPRVARPPVIREFHFAGTPLTSHSVQTALVAMAVARGYRVGEAAIIYRPAAGGGGGLRGADVMAFAQHLLALRKRVDRTRQRRPSPAGRRFSNDHFGAAHDLERPGTAQRFFDWVLDAFHPYLRGRVLPPLGKNVILIAVKR